MPTSQEALAAFQQARANLPSISGFDAARQHIDNQIANIQLHMQQEAMMEAAQAPIQAPPASAAEQALADIAGETFESTAPFRQEFLGQAQDILTGRTSPQDLPFFAPAFAEGKRALEGQFGRAREDILGMTTPGGGQQELLAGLAGQRAQQVGSLPSMISQGLMQDVLNKSFGAAFGAPGQAMGGFGTAAGLDVSRQGIGAQQQGNLLNMLASNFAAQAGLQGMREQAQGMQGQGQGGNIFGQMLGFGLGGGFNPLLGGLFGGGGGGFGNPVAPLRGGNR
jgi:hypothetical protein